MGSRIRKMTGMRRTLFVLTIFGGLFFGFPTSEAQRLSQGASDWYMRFHSNYVKYKRDVDPPEVTSFWVSSHVQRSYAVTTVTMKLHNPATVEQIYHFGLAMPKEALVSNVTIQSATSATAMSLKASQFMTQFWNDTEAADEDIKHGDANTGNTASEVTVAPNDNKVSFHQFVLPIKLKPKPNGDVS